MADTTVAAPGGKNKFAPRSFANGTSDGRNTHGQNYSHNSSQNQSMNGMNWLTQGLAAMNMQDGTGYSNPPRSASITAPAANAYNAYNFSPAIPNAFWPANGHQMMMGAQQFNQATPQSAAMYSPAQFMTAGYGRHDNSPMPQGWTPSQMSGEMPSLITPRRESMSSAENDTPGTPNYPGFHPMAPVAIINRSPSGTFTASTPSPLQMVFQNGMSMNKNVDSENISPRLKMLVTKEPSIPLAIPAPSSPLKPLDRALENPRGETNVYIRGLMPETTDEMLEDWGRRFGDIKSSKSIIDHVTGQCKGFGFVRYHNYKDAEDCIRGFHHLGYEVSFARESFYSKLKAIADDSNTNLYVSNLPKSMNEHELANIFAPHKVCSARILRNSNGAGRGVGFARFEVRTDCEEIIRTFNNKVIKHDGEEHTIQIRYADTQEQKHLKQTTAAARAFRSAEYDYATTAHRQGFRIHQPMTSPDLSGQSSGDFEGFVSPHSNVPARAWGAPETWRPMPSNRNPLSAMSPNNHFRRNGSVSINSTPLAKVSLQDHSDGGVTLRSENVTPAIVHGDKSPTRVG